MNPALKVAIVHYHLRPGGVSSVIGRALESLRALDARAVVLTGRPPEGNQGQLPCVCLPGLDYSASGQVGTPEDLAREMAGAAGNALGGSPDLWHIHNHALGKNILLSASVTSLARDGHRILLQIHDFAEDGCPANYARLRAAFGAAGAMQSYPLYPQADHVHYAVLNRRDQSWLCGAGADQARVHWLPNSIPAGISAARPAPPAAGRRWVYPARAIRRKNIGEFLLWAAAAKSGEQFAVTLAPTSPSDCARYERWKEFAAELKLPVEFETGLKSGAPPWWQQCDCAVTTSVAEGFGLAFLEPWMAALPLVGRDLPEITGDLKSAGMDFSMLYARLDVPLKWLDAAAFRERFNARLLETWKAYGRELPADAPELAWQSSAAGDAFDFGNWTRRHRKPSSAGSGKIPHWRETCAPPACRWSLRAASRPETQPVFKAASARNHTGNALWQPTRPSCARRRG
ncbi:MAG: hypothetical protein WC299_09735 [Kiritimatiellia bacterium]